jgi:hypothetical protein
MPESSEPVTYTRTIVNRGAGTTGGVAFAIVFVWVLETWFMPIDPETMERVIVENEVALAMGGVFSILGNMLMKKLG